MLRLAVNSIDTGRAGLSTRWIPSWTILSTKTRSPTSCQMRLLYVYQYFPRIFNGLTNFSHQKPKVKAKPAATKAKKLTQTTLKTKPAAKATKKKAKADSENESSDRDDIDDFLDSVMSTTPPSKPKAKKAPAKKAGSKPLADVANESFGGDGADDGEAEATTQTGAGDKYQKVNFVF